MAERTAVRIEAQQQVAEPVDKGEGSTPPTGPAPPKLAALHNRRVPWRPSRCHSNSATTVLLLASVIATCRLPSSLVMNRRRCPPTSNLAEGIPIPPMGEPCKWAAGGVHPQLESVLEWVDQVPGKAVRGSALLVVSDRCRLARLVGWRWDRDQPRREGPGLMTEPVFVSGPFFPDRCGRDGVVCCHGGISQPRWWIACPDHVGSHAVRRVRDTMGTSRHSQGRGSASSSKAPGA
jgi:hypothetical protein